MLQRRRGARAGARSRHSANCSEVPIWTMEGFVRNPHTTAADEVAGPGWPLRLRSVDPSEPSSKLHTQGGTPVYRSGSALLSYQLANGESTTCILRRPRGRWKTGITSSEASRSARRCSVRALACPWLTPDRAPMSRSGRPDLKKRLQ